MNKLLLLSCRQSFTCVVRCHLHCGKVLTAHDNTSRLQYNYGLPGKGKSKKTMWTKQHIETSGEILFGIHPVTLALTASHRQRFYKLYISSRHQKDASSRSVTIVQDLASQRGIPVEFVQKQTLNFLAGNRPHQGVCLDVSPRVFPLCDPADLMQSASLSADALWLLLYNVQDPMNFGAILRSSYFFGVNKIIVPTENSCAASPVVSKASAGAMEMMDIMQVDGRFATIKQLAQTWQSCGGQVVGTTGVDASESQRTTSTLQNYSVAAPTLLIVGNEGFGVDEDVLDLCNTLLTISPPAHNLGASNNSASLHVQSLNVSVATGILVHWLRSSLAKSVNAPQ